MKLKVYKSKPISPTKTPILATQKLRQIIFLTKQKKYFSRYLFAAAFS
jgi:hypothetical protein